MDEKKIKSNLRRKRIEKGWSQQRMADEMDIDRNTYINLENGCTHMLSRRLYDAAGVLGCSLESLLTEEKNADGTNPAYYAEHGELEENFVHLRNELEALKKENADLNADVEKLKAEKAALEEKNSHLEDLYRLQKEVAEYSKRGNG